MGITYDDRLNEEICRRNAAMERMRLACTATKETVQDEVAGLKEDYHPSNIVRRNPLYTLLGALVAGGAFAFLIKKIFFSTKEETQVVTAGATGQPQRVVVEVKSAEPKVKRSHHSGWKEIFDAAMAGVPALAAFVEKHLNENRATSNGGGAPAERTEAMAGVGAGAEKVEKKQSPPFQASISRRSAPPPRES